MSKLNSKQGIINTLLACMDYNKPDDTWHIKANGIDDLASDLEDKFNNVDLADVSKRDTLFEASRDISDLSDDFEPKNDKAFNAMEKLMLEVAAIEDVNDIV